MPGPTPLERGQLDTLRARLACIDGVTVREGYVLPGGQIELDLDISTQSGPGGMALSTDARVTLPPGYDVGADQGLVWFVHHTGSGARLSVDWLRPGPMRGNEAEYAHALAAAGAMVLRYAKPGVEQRTGPDGTTQPDIVAEDMIGLDSVEHRDVVATRLEEVARELGGEPTRGVVTADSAGGLNADLGAVAERYAAAIKVNSPANGLTRLFRDFFGGDPPWSDLDGGAVFTMRDAWRSQRAVDPAGELVARCQRANVNLSADEWPPIDELIGLEQDETAALPPDQMQTSFADLMSGYSTFQRLYGDKAPRFTRDRIEGTVTAEKLAKVFYDDLQRPMDEIFAAVWKEIERPSPDQLIAWKRAGVLDTEMRDLYERAKDIEVGSDVTRNWGPRSLSDLAEYDAAVDGDSGFKWLSWDVRGDASAIAARSKAFTVLITSVNDDNVPAPDGGDKHEYESALQRAHPGRVQALRVHDTHRTPLVNELKLLVALELLRALQAGKPLPTLDIDALLEEARRRLDIASG